MSSPKMSQTVLYEILVREVESLKRTKGDFDKILGVISDHLKRLEELYKQPIAVNIDAMVEEHERIKSTLSRGLYLPKWLVITFLSLVLGLRISLFFNYKQYITNNDHLDYIRETHRYIKELEGQVGKNKHKR